MSRFLESIHRHLRLRLIIWLFVVPAPPLLLTVWFAQQGYSNLETEQKDAQQALAIRALDTLDRILYERYGDARVFAQLPVVRALETDRIAEVAEAVVTTYAPYYALIVVADRKGIIRVVNPVDGSGRPISSGKLIGQSVSGQPWFEQALAAQSVRVEDFHEDPLAGQVYGQEGAVVMTFSAPIRGGKVKGQGGEVLGVWSARIPERVIAQALEGESSRSGRAGDVRMALFTKDGRRVAGAFQSRGQDVLGPDDHPLAAATSSGFRDYPGVGWTLSLFAPVEGAPPRTPFSLPVAGGIVITIIAGMVFLARAANRVVLDPLYRLAHAAESLKRGEPGVLPREPGRLDVIGVLQKELADMVEALRARETQARDAAAALEDRTLALHKLLEVIREVTAVTNLDTLLQRLAETACRLTGARYGALGVFEADTERLSQFFTTGIDEHTKKAIGALPVGRGLLGALAHDKEALRLKDLAQHPTSVGFPPHHPPMHSFLGVPIRIRGRLFGQLYLTEKQGAAEFTELDEKLIVGLAAQAGVAIEIARLLQDVRAAEAQYHAAKDQLTNVLEYAPDPIIFTDLNGNITLYNEGAERVLGYAAAEMLGKPTTDLYLDPAERATTLAELEANGEVIGREVRLRTKDGGTVTLSLTLSPYRDAEGHVIGTVGVSKDITAAKLMEQALRTSNQELEDFVFVVSHDLQTPLRGIHGFADLLVKRMKDKLDERERHYVARIQSGAQRMATLIHDLLEYSRLEQVAQPFEEVRMQDVLARTLGDLDHLIRDSRAVVQCEGPLPVVWGDRTRLGLVWANLLTNAIKYVKPDEAPRISVRCRVDEREFVFQFQDNGIGIPPEFHTHIFDLFRRLHTTEKYEGTGVGLAIVKRVVELHHGRIWVESAEDQGTTFWFTLPKTQLEVNRALPGNRNPVNTKENAS